MAFSGVLPPKLELINSSPLSKVKVIGSASAVAELFILNKVLLITSVTKLLSGITEPESDTAMPTRICLFASAVVSEASILIILGLEPKSVPVPAVSLVLQSKVNSLVVTNVATALSVTVILVSVVPWTESSCCPKYGPFL